MAGARPQLASDDSEEARAFLQDRVALFWKVQFFIILFGSGLGAVGALAQRGWDFWLTLGVTALAGVFWWVCRRGKRSLRFSRLMEGGAFLFLVAIGATTSRYLLVGVAHDRKLVDASAIMMADAYVAMLQLFGTGLQVALRAALVPSQPRRTVIVTALVGLPSILAASLLLPGEGGALELRPLDSPVFPWLPVTAVVMWAFVVFVASAISRIIYGLRVEVREARRLGQYTLEKKIGEGGMGEVYRAHHGMMRRPSAIKLLRGQQASETQLKRFEREVQLTARLTHPNTITIFDYGRTNDGVFYYAKLLDFGLVKELSVDGEAQLTGVSTLLGTPQYMAPEAILEANAAEARSDIYALGAVAYYLLAGVDVFEGKSVIELCIQHIHHAPESLIDRGVDVPPELDALILACLAKKPEQRPQTAAELRKRLEACIVTPWTAEDARNWWDKHQSEVQRDEMPSTEPGKTVEVAGHAHA